jgi:hypothetical protein
MFHQGRARRHHGFDRRLKKPLPKIQEPAVEEVTDVLPTPPRADVRDALQAREPPYSQGVASDSLLLTLQNFGRTRGLKCSIRGRQTGATS